MEHGLRKGIPFSKMKKWPRKPGTICFSELEGEEASGFGGVFCAIPDGVTGAAGSRFGFAIAEADVAEPGAIEVAPGVGAIDVIEEPDHQVVVLALFAGVEEVLQGKTAINDGSGIGVLVVAAANEGDGIAGFFEFGLDAVGVAAEGDGAGAKSQGA